MRFIQISSKALLFLGIICFFYLGIIIWQRFSPLKRANAFPVNPPLSKQPINLAIRQLNIDLPVIPLSSEKDRLPTTSKGVAYLINSALPGEKDNSIFYGHNWPNLLKSLTKAQLEQIIEIRNQRGEVKQFTIIKTELVGASNEEIIKPTNKAQLIIYTCAGFLDQNRFIVTAIPF